MRQNARVQHVGIGQHDVGPFANGAARVLRRVAIVGERAQFGTHGIHRRLKFVKLILGQRLGRKQIHRARAGIGDQPIQHRQVVAEGLAAGGGRDHHHIAAGRRARRLPPGASRAGEYRASSAPASARAPTRPESPRTRRAWPLAAGRPAPAIPDRPSTPQIVRWRRRCPWDARRGLNSPCLRLSCRIPERKASEKRRFLALAKELVALQGSRESGSGGAAHHLADAAQTHVCARSGHLRQRDQVLDRLADLDGACDVNSTPAELTFLVSPLDLVRGAPPIISKGSRKSKR